MRKLIAFLTGIVMMASLAGCGSEAAGSGTSDSSAASVSASEESEEAESSESEASSETSSESLPAESSERSGTSSESGSNILIAYFSVPEDVDTNGADAVAGASVVVKDGEIMGNVQFMAGIIQETVGGDLFRIETVQQYPLDHDPLVDQAAEEQDEDARPELATHIEIPDQYDTIILGCPNWWGDMPQALYTFLEEDDFSGKTIIPFCPHGGSGFSRTERTIAALQPDAIVSENGLTISRNVVADSEEDIIAWAEGLGL